MKILDFIEDAKRELQKNNVIPTWIKLSPQTHQILLDEINKRDGRRHKQIVQIIGLKVEIDYECPPGGAYMGRDPDPIPDEIGPGPALGEKVKS